MKDVRASAKKTVYDVCGIKAGERVLIITNRVEKDGVADTEVISQAIYDECLEVGADPVIITQPVKSSLDAADKAVIAAIALEPDVCMSISAEKLGKDAAAITNPYVGEDGDTYDHVFDYMLRSRKNMRAVWTPGITLDMFNSTVDIDYPLLKKRCSTLCELYKNVERVHITAPAGTDVVIPVKGRNPMSDDGDFTKGGSGGNIPAGEVFISPVVGDGVSTGCQGKIVFDGSIAVKYGTVKIETPIETVVENGFITDIRGGKEADMLLDTITTAERSAKEMGEDGRLPKDVAESYRRNARNIGELGIGLNPAASIKGNMLEDEKAFNTCHIAIGENYDNDASALIHLDGVIKNPTIVFVYEDGSEKTVLLDGVLQF